MVGVAETCGGLAVEGFAVVRMGDGNQGLGPFRQILVAEIDTSIFSDHILRLEAGCDDSGTGSESWDYLATSFSCT